MAFVSPPNYGINTKVLDKLMEQHRPRLPSEEEEDDEIDIEGIQAAGFAGPEVGAPPGPGGPPPLVMAGGLPPPVGGGGPPPRGATSDPGFMSALAKSSAQLGTLGGKASDTSAVSDYAKNLQGQALNRQKMGAIRNQKVMDYLAKIQMNKDKVSGRTKEKRDLYERMRRDKKADRDESRSFAKSEEQRKNYIPGVGVGRETRDVEQVKAGTIAKKKFDNALDEMISLREKHKGGTITNRSDVARGKQLSKDLLLAYKNMAKLGVLSKADEDIINAIIPDDPLAYSAADFGLGGDDAILRKLYDFRRDSDKDYMNTIHLRVKDIDPALISDYQKRSEIYADRKKPQSAPGDAILSERTAIANPGEVKRKTKDGKTAIFDAKTKEFIRYE